MQTPYLPNTDVDRRAILKAVGVSSNDVLFRDIPHQYLNVPFRLPLPLSELELKKELQALAGRNVSLDEYACFLGAGFYHHFIPSVVGHITSRSEFYTAYTPYQAEASQGTLQAMYEYQSMVCRLTGMEVSNAGLYDGSTATAEAALMACRVTQREKVAVLSTVNPNYVNVVKTYLSGRGLPPVKISEGQAIPADAACLIVQQPNFFGHFEDLSSLVKRAHDAGAILVTIADPISLGLFKSPGEYGADIVVGEGQALGNPVSFGGPGLGIFACRKDYLRQVPGRIVGKTADAEGNPGYVLTLSTREQHIRRERATSNITTNEALVALAATVYLAALGKRGLRQVAELCYHKAHYAAQAISQLKGYSLAFNQPFFKEFAIRCPVPPPKINKALYRKKIIGGLDISDTIEDGMLLCVTEMNTKAEIDRLAAVMGEF